MNISDKQLTALMDWVLSAILFSKNYDTLAAQQEAIRKRDEMYAAFGFVCGSNNRPVVPQALGPTTAICKSCGQHFPVSQPHFCPGLLAAIPDNAGPTTEHQQAEADADYDAKHEAVCKVLTDDGFFHVNQVAKDLMRLWPELKAIMEPERCTLCGRRLPDEMCGPCRRDEGV